VLGVRELQIDNKIENSGKVVKSLEIMANREDLRCLVWSKHNFMKTKQS
jgi:hypothetical protein